MNVSLPNFELVRDTAPVDSPSVRRVRSLLSLFCVYTAALLAVLVLSDGGDIGCILAGIALHVFYATTKAAIGWRDAWLIDTRLRLRRA